MLWFPSKHGSEMEIAAGGVPALAAHTPVTVCKGWLAVKLRRSHLGIRQSFFFCCFSSEQTASCQHRAGREQRAQDGAEPSGEQRLPRARARLQAPRSAEQLRRKLASSSFSWSFNYFLYFSMKGERRGGGGMIYRDREKVAALVPFQAQLKRKSLRAGKSLQRAWKS